MNAIELIKEDQYKEGDAIRITCTLGVKEGIIMDFLEDRIRLRPYDSSKKPISILDSTIGCWEEGEIPEVFEQSTNSSSLNSSKNDSKGTVTSPVNKLSLGTDVNITTANQIETQENNQEVDKTGSQDLSNPIDSRKENENPQLKNTTLYTPTVIGPKILGHIDLDRKDTSRPMVHKSVQSPFSVAFREQILTTTSNDERFAKAVKRYDKDDENHSVIKATGFIRKLYKTLDGKEYGYIWNQSTQSEVWFSFNELCDDDLLDSNAELKGLHVVYNIVPGLQNKPMAVCICLPHTISELLAMADDANLDGYKSVAFEMSLLILAQYPTCISAKLLYEELLTHNKHKTGRLQTSLFDLENLKNAIPTSAGTKEPTKTINNCTTIYPSNLTERRGKDYRKYQELMNKKEREKALPYLLKAIASASLFDLPSMIKDGCSLYSALCGKKFVDGHPENVEKAKRYRAQAIEFLKKHSSSLPKDESGINILESTYYVLREYQKYLEIVDKIIQRKPAKDRAVYQTKKAIALIGLKKKNEARKLLTEIIEYNPNNPAALALIEQIDSQKEISNEDLDALLEASDNPISPFLKKRIDLYKEFFGVANYLRNDESRLFTESTYKTILDQLNDEGINSDSQKRALLILTKVRIAMKLYDGKFDKTDMGRYCYDMARNTMRSDHNNIPWDVVRFYFNEGFSLYRDWFSVRRAFIQYIETSIKGRRNNLFGKLPDDQIKNRLMDDLRAYVQMPSESSELDWVDGLIHPSIYNIDLSNHISSALYNDNGLRNIAVKKLKELGIEMPESIDEISFVNAWNALKTTRYHDIQRINNSFWAKLDSNDSLLRLNGSMDKLREETLTANWLFSKDKQHLADLFLQLVPKIDSYFKASSFISKEDNYNDGNRLIKTICEDIEKNPTKFSYETLLPFLQYYQRLLNHSWEEIKLTSKPKVSIELLGDSVCIDDTDRTVRLQISVSNDRDSSPVSNIDLRILNSSHVTYLPGEVSTLHTDMMKGGDSPLIYHLDIQVAQQAIDEKTVSLTAECSYTTTNNEIENVQKELAVRFYDSSEFEIIKNPYNAGDQVTDPSMFFGRDAFIDNLANMMEASPTKQVIFYGQKRCGKSSVLYWLQQKLTAQGAFCVRFSIGDILMDMREVTFYYQILHVIKLALKKAKRRGAIVPDFEVPTSAQFESMNPNNPLMTFKEYIGLFKEACCNTPEWKNNRLVVMVDEFTYIYSYIKQGKLDDSLMRQWKSLVQDPDSGFAAVLVGQDVVPYFKKEDYAQNAFAIIDDVRLNYLEEPDARDLIVNPILYNGQSRYATGAVEKIIEYTACSPYYIQMLCSNLVAHMNKNKAIIATTADVIEVAEDMVLKMSDAEFDNLISGGDQIEFADINSNTILAILYRIAKLTQHQEFCSKYDIIHFFNEPLLEEEENVVSSVLENLENREVIEIREGLYRIQVKLFQQWIIRKKNPEVASLLI